MPGGLPDLRFGFQPPLRIALSFVLRDIRMTAAAMVFGDLYFSRVAWWLPTAASRTGRLSRVSAPKSANSPMLNEIYADETAELGRSAGACARCGRQWP